MRRGGGERGRGEGEGEGEGEGRGERGEGRRNRAGGRRDRKHTLFIKHSVWDRRDKRFERDPSSGDGVELH